MAHPSLCYTTIVNFVPRVRLGTSLLLIVAAVAIAQQREDTARLAAHLKVLRGKKWITDAERRSIEREYLEWIDSRVYAGRNVEAMNRELDTAGLFVQWRKTPEAADTLDELYASHAGYLGPISTKPIHSRGDLVVIGAGVYMGEGCSLDVTAVVYKRLPAKRLATINAEGADQSRYAYHLDSIDIGAEGNGGQLAASAWGVSNCTSSWNGKRIRIDRLRTHRPATIFARDLAAQDNGDGVSSRVDGDVATFLYHGATGDTDLISGPSVARYRVSGDAAILESPVALTRAGFIHEWLGMSEADAKRWSDPKAASAKSGAAATLSHGFEWETVARCSGSPPVWEVALRPADAKTLQVFRIAGARATEFRMLAATNTVTDSCVADDLSTGLASIAAELPW